MKPVTQTLLFETHGKGNCLAAAIASLFEVEIADLPALHGKNSGEQYGQLNKFARSRGLIARREYPRNGGGTPIFRGYYIASGPGARGVRHACVYLDGELAHDPHPSGAGLLSVDEITIFIPLDISKWKLHGGVA